MFYFIKQQYELNYVINFFFINKLYKLLAGKIRFVSNSVSLMKLEHCVI